MSSQTTRRRALSVLCGLPVCGLAEVHPTLEARVSIDLSDYQSVLGVINQLAILTRPEILFGIAGESDLEQGLTTSQRSLVFVDEKLTYVLDTLFGSSSPFTWQFDSVYNVINIFPKLAWHTANRVISIKARPYNFKGRAWPFNLTTRYSESCLELQEYLAERRREYLHRNPGASVSAHGGASMRTNVEPPQYDLQLREDSIMRQLNHIAAYTRTLTPIQMDNSTTGFLTKYAYGWLVTIRPSSADLSGLGGTLDWSHFPK